MNTFLCLSVLITELFPTFGYPMKPTEICCLSLCNCENCCSKLIIAPLPKGFFMLLIYKCKGFGTIIQSTDLYVTLNNEKNKILYLAWQAIVGYSLESNFIHLRVIQVGMRSTCTSKYNLIIMGQNQQIL